MKELDILPYIKSVIKFSEEFDKETTLIESSESFSFERVLEGINNKVFPDKLTPEIEKILLESGSYLEIREKCLYFKTYIFNMDELDKVTEDLKHSLAMHPANPNYLKSSFKISKLINTYKKLEYEK